VPLAIVGLMVCREKIESQLSHALSNFLEISYNDIQEGPQKMTVVIIGTRSRIPPPKGLF